MLGFDIETGPEEEAVLKKRYQPFDPASVKHPGVFDPASVKYGNTKDPVKRAEKLEESQLGHMAALANYKQDVEKAAAEHWGTYVEKAALHPATGRLLAFGGATGSADAQRTIIHLAEFPNEQDFLAECWNVLKYHRAATKTGWNIHGFDVPFMILRSAILQVEVPAWVRDKKQFFDSTFIDLQKVWAFPQLYNPFGNNKLNTVATAVGIGGKLDEVDGADFHKFYFGTPEERIKALAYLDQDLVLTWGMANFLQVL